MLYTFRVGGKIAECLDEKKNRTDFIKSAIEMAKIESEPDFSQLVLYIQLPMSRK